MFHFGSLWILMTLTMIFGLGPSGGHEIVELVVPLLADPRENATLSCRYNMGSDRLYSAKWFKDEAEIFRYMPGERPPGLPFPVAGVRLARPPRCSPVTCDLELSNLTASSAGVYRCEVSTEAPTFRIVHKSSNMTIAALPRRDPRIEGLQPRYSLEEEIRVNCTSDASLPAADVMWYVNEIEASFLNLEGFSSSPPDPLGLVRRSQGLRLVAERALFQSGGLRLRCSSALPGWVVGGPHRRQTVGVTSLQSPALLDTLAWLGSSGEKISRSSMTTFIQLLFYSYYLISE